jgi:hypothetical protein
MTLGWIERRTDQFQRFFVPKSIRLLQFVRAVPVRRPPGGTKNLGCVLPAGVSGSDISGRTRLKEAVMSDVERSAKVPCLPSIGTSKTSPLPKQKPNGADDCLSAAEVEQFRQKALSRETSDEVAEELSAALGLAQRIRSKDLYIDSAADRMRYIFECLLADKPKLILAQDERLRLQMDTYRKGGGLTKYLAVISSGSTATLVLMALCASLSIWTLAIIVILTLARGVAGIYVNILGYHFRFDSTELPTGVFFMDGKGVLVIVSAAFLGGMVSIATRMREFSRIRDLDPFSMFWTAMLKPLIGVILSVFLFAMLAGGVISFGFLENDAFGVANQSGSGGQSITVKTLYVLWVLGFLSGFSERFAWDFVDRAQGIAAGGLSKDKTAQT